MSNTTEQLVVSLEARVRDFERNFQKATSTSDREWNKIERRSRDAGNRMQENLSSASGKINATLAGIGKAGLAGLAGALAIGGIDQLIGQYRAVATGIANIGNEARRAGLSTKAFQELTFVADQTRIPIDALVDGMKELSLRADEYIVTGAGSSAEAFQRLGFSASDLKERLKDPSALLVEIIRRMEQLDRAAQIRIADEIFGGTGGEQFVELLNKGSAGIQQMIKDASSFGLVLDEAMIARADEIDRKFSLLATTVGTGLKAAILDATEALTGFLDQFKAVDQQGASTLQASIARNVGDMKTIRDEIAGLQSQQNDALLPWLKGGNDPQIRLLEAQHAKIKAEDDRLRALLKERAGSAVYGPMQPKPTAPPKPLTFTPLPSTAAGNSTDILASRLAPGKAREHVDGLASDLKEALNKALASAPESVRNATTLNSGYRSFERQAQLWAEALKKYGSPEAARKWVAPPGKSQHQDGEAADLGFQTAEARKWFHDNAASFGLTFQMAHEPWHVETTGARRKTNDAEFRERYEARQGQDEAYAGIIAGATDAVAAQNLEAQALGLTTAKAAALRYESDLLNQATQAGIELTPERVAQLQTLAQVMGEGEAATLSLADAQARQIEKMDEFRDVARGSLGGFISDLRAGKSETEALGNVFASLADRLLESGLDQIIAGMFGQAGTAGGGLLGGIQSFNFGRRP